MSWLALLLIGIGLADLGHSIRPVRHLPELVAAALTVLIAVAADLTEARDLAAVIVIVAVVLAWGRTVREGFGREESTGAGKGLAWLPLSMLAAAVIAAILLSPYANRAGGGVEEWLQESTLETFVGLSADRALLILGVLLVQMSTGNVIVRLVLRATGTVDPGRGAAHDARRTLKGGRLLGPMERLVILGLGLAGHLTAASVVVAAKGLIRWPELQARRGEDGPDIDEVTEYFLVGSFVSWLVPLGCLVLLAQ